MALAASVVLMFRYPEGGLAVVRFTPGAVSATYDCRMENGARTKWRSTAPSAMTPG